MSAEDQRWARWAFEHTERCVADTLGELRTCRTVRSRLRLEHGVANMLRVARKLLSEAHQDGAPGFDREADTNAQLERFYAGMAAFRRAFAERASAHERAIASATPDLAAIDAMFTAEERHGRCLDLVLHHRAWLDILARASVATDTEYASYISSFDDLARPRAAATASGSHAAYAAYVRGLASYLASFVRRARPLACAEAADTLAPPVDALYCSPCDRRFASETVFAHHLSGRKHLRAALLFRSGAAERHASLPGAEAEVLRYGAMLGDVRVATRSAVEARQTLTAAERAAMSLAHDDDESGESSSTDSDTPDANPLRLPLDWDGRPMPYWLWRLQGLGTRYTCAICGGHAYAGRRAFDAHFYEWRHAAAMRALGIPNTRHFFHVTAVDDARALWDRMRRTSKADVLDTDAVEECEDRRGNVYTRRTYNDLVRQGLL